MSAATPRLLSSFSYQATCVQPSCSNSTFASAAWSSAPGSAPKKLPTMMMTTLYSFKVNSGSYAGMSFLRVGASPSK